MHKSVGNHGGCVADAHTNRFFGLLQNEQIRVVGANQELQMELDGNFSREDAVQFLDSALVLLVLVALNKHSTNYYYRRSRV